MELWAGVALLLGLLRFRITRRLLLISSGAMASQICLVNIVGYLTIPGGFKKAIMLVLCLREGGLLDLGPD